MEDTPEDLPKPPRRTAARPFFSPRPEGITGPLELSRRRSAQLFTPPGSSPGTSSMPSPETPTASGRTADAESAAAADDVAATADAQAVKSYDTPALGADGEWTPAAARDAEETLDADSLLAHRNTVDDGDALYVEQFEPEDIELTSASATTIPDEHSIEVIAYDDANSLLKAAASEGERPQVDGLHIETTEFSFHGTPREPPLEVESFWATEPFAANAQPSAEAEPREEVEVERAEMALDDAEVIEEHHEAHPLEWGNVDTMRADSAPAIADNRPPWVGRPTPASTQALEELKESEPWSLSPAVDDVAMDDVAMDDVAMDDIAMEQIEPVEIAADDVAVEEVEEVEAAAPAGALAMDVHALEATASHPIADVLERIAARLRDGEIEVPAGSELNEAAALAAVLTAMLRQAR